MTEDAKSDPFEAELDRLFQLPPTAMVDARDALAARLRKSGEREAAQRVKSLKRPTPAAWALNQVHFRRAELLDRALEQAAQVRALHARDAVAPSELWAAVSAQRAAANEVVEAALRCCEQAGLAHGASQQKRLLATVQGWLAGLGDQAPGRMTHDLEAGGFDAIANVGAAAPRPPVARPATPRPSVARPAPAPPSPPPVAAAVSRVKPPAPDPAALARAGSELRACERRAREAREQVRERRAEQSRAERDVERANARVRELESALAEAQALLRTREGERALAQSALAEALASERSAEAALASARAALAALQRPGS